MKLHEMRKKGTAAVNGMRTLVDTASLAGRDLTADESTHFETLKTEK
jgi:hypothetical protein